MTGSGDRVLGLLVTSVLLATLTACSHTNVATQSDQSAYRWAAAKDQYGTGDYVKAIASLDRLTEATNAYSSRAIPFTVVLSSGVAAGYIELADYYAAGARANKGKALLFQRKASDYRSLANHMVLHFAQTAKMLEGVEGDSVQLAFGPPKGNAVEPALFTQIAHGMELSQADEEAALSIALNRGVMLSVCSAAGAPNNLAKASEILQRGEFLVRRAKFMKAVSDLLEQESQLYSRTKLDDSSKLTMVHQAAQAAAHDAGGTHSTMVTQVAER